MSPFSVRIDLPKYLDLHLSFLYCPGRGHGYFENFFLAVFTDGNLIDIKKIFDGLHFILFAMHLKCLLNILYFGSPFPRLRSPYYHHKGNQRGRNV